MEDEIYLIIGSGRIRKMVRTRPTEESINKHEFVCCIPVSVDDEFFKGIVAGCSYTQPVHISFANMDIEGETYSDD